MKKEHSNKLPGGFTDFQKHIRNSITPAYTYQIPSWALQMPMKTAMTAKQKPMKSYYRSMEQSSFY